MREIVFDTETTGLNPTEGHKVVEIGCVELINRVESGRTFHCYINPQRTMPPEAQAVHGLSDAFLSDKPVFSKIVEDFLGFVGDAPLVAHNAEFDMRFINAELAACGRPRFADGAAIDTLVLARKRFPGAKHTLDALCTRFGVDRSSRIKHGALLDAQLLAQVYVELVGGRQIGFELAAEVEESFETTVVVQRQYRAPRPHGPSALEKEAHDAFIASIKEAIWLQP